MREAIVNLALVGVILLSSPDRTVAIGYAAGRRPTKVDQKHPSTWQISKEVLATRKRRYRNMVVSNEFETINHYHFRAIYLLGKPQING